MVGSFVCARPVCASSPKTPEASSPNFPPVFPVSQPSSFPTSNASNCPTAAAKHHGFQCQHFSAPRSSPPWIKKVYVTPMDGVSRFIIAAALWEEEKFNSSPLNGQWTPRKTTFNYRTLSLTRTQAGPDLFSGKRPTLNNAAKPSTRCVTEIRKKQWVV